MTKLEWWQIYKYLIPFISANFLFAFLIYFTLVRKRIVREYPYYLCFLVAFIIFLGGRIVSLLPFGSIGGYLLYIRMGILFSLGLPSLLILSIIKCGISLRRGFHLLLYLGGGVCSFIYIVMIEAREKETGIAIILRKISWLSTVDKNYISRFQLGVILIFLVIPAIVLLVRKSRKSKPIVFLAGVLAFGLFMAIGSLTREWWIYYVGSIPCVAIWGTTVLRQIQEMDRRTRAHYTHEKSLAIAQYASGNSSGEVSALELYPVVVDEQYPFREREDLLNAVATNSMGLIPERGQALIDALVDFSRGNIVMCRARVREVVFMTIDARIFAGGNPKELMTRLEMFSRDINGCNTSEDLVNKLKSEMIVLAELECEQSQEIVDDTIEQAKEFILAHYHKDFGVDDIAEKIGISSSSLMARFKKETGKTVNQYLTEIRITKARKILLFKSVTDTGYDVGFKSTSYFGSVFKKHTGMTPSQYQQSAKKQ